MAQVAEQFVELSMGDTIEDAVNDAVQACGGDPLEAVAALIRGQQQLRSEFDGAVSAGYVRRRLFQ